MRGIGYIDEALIQEAEAHRHSAAPAWQRWGAVAACAVILFGAAAILPRFSHQGDVLNGGAASMSSEAGKDYATIIDMSRITVNKLTVQPQASRLWFDPEKHDDLDWKKDDILRYFGKELAPAYLPAGLTAAASNGNARAIAKKDGTIVYDTVWLQYYHDYYEDGSPKHTENIAAEKGFTLLASKLGRLSDCCYILPEDEVKVSEIGGTAVTIGYRKMDYGPYDPQTHEPAGWYNLYVISFCLDEIDYELTSHQMELEEVLKVTASILTGSSEVLIQSVQ